MHLLLQRELNGHKYFEFEYTAKTQRYTRHSLAVVVANDGGLPAVDDTGTRCNMGTVNKEFPEVMQAPPVCAVLCPT